MNYIIHLPFNTSPHTGSFALHSYIINENKHRNIVELLTILEQNACILLSFLCAVKQILQGPVFAFKCREYSSLLRQTVS